MKNTLIHSFQSKQLHKNQLLDKRINLNHSVLQANKPKTPREICTGKC